MIVSDPSDSIQRDMRVATETVRSILTDFSGYLAGSNSAVDDTEVDAPQDCIDQIEMAERTEVATRARFSFFRLFGRRS